MQDAFEQAKTLQAAGKLDEAAAAYRQVVAASPESIKAWNNLGTVLEQQEAGEPAVECYRRALAPSRRVVGTNSLARSEDGLRGICHTIAVHPVTDRIFAPELTWRPLATTPGATT